MRPLNATELLQVWETGWNRPLLEKSLRLLGVACSQPNLDAVATLSIGERDARLLQLREWMFGRQLFNTARCPKCGAAVEWETDLKTLYLQPSLPEAALKELSLEMDGFQLRFRLLNSNDLSNAASGAVYESKELLASCIRSVQYEQQPYEADAMPEIIWAALQQRMAEEDPQADIQMLVHCPVCSYSWEMPFDIMSYLWIEIENWARHMLQEIFSLARAFGWAERDILNMSAQRRQLYLEMLKA